MLETRVVALGFPICFYYGFTGVACGLVLPPRVFDSARKFLLVASARCSAALIMFGIGVKAIVHYGHKAKTSKAKPYPRHHAAAVDRRDRRMVLGVVLMLVSRPFFREFFSRKTETAPPGLLDAPVEHAPTHLMGPEHVTHGVHVLEPEAGEPSGPPPGTGDAS